MEGLQDGHIIDVRQTIPKKGNYLIDCGHFEGGYALVVPRAEFLQLYNLIVKLA